jgi:hypothetical protein
VGGGSHAANLQQAGREGRQDGRQGGSNVSGCGGEMSGAAGCLPRGALTANKVGKAGHGLRSSGQQQAAAAAAASPHASWPAPLTSTPFWWGCMP